ncbi:hypothetical protein B5E53_16915 [Eubacterium sp. An11]|uniref:InlB B-repeat-containing protein n=1 Tax=Eubacterium sp. An11 TaxID=1965542 RepID=UPI000B394006|nr:InlB B-repeat-containing protein [Eubacterium sp. An11]OUQ62904.1 hypothetical protein B5E53_16915 [Eubacterium sp. An11]
MVQIKNNIWKIFFGIFILTVAFITNKENVRAAIDECELVYKSGNNYYSVADFGETTYKSVKRDLDFYIKMTFDSELVWQSSLKIYVSDGDGHYSTSSLSWSDMEDRFEYDNKKRYAYFPISSILASQQNFIKIFFDVILANGNYLQTADLNSTNAFYIRMLGDYTISYNANGGTGAPASQTKYKESVLTLSTQKPKRTGYIFKGWAVTNTAESATYQPGGSYSSNSDVVLYAVWEKEEEQQTSDNGQTQNPGHNGNQNPTNDRNEIIINRDSNTTNNSVNKQKQEEKTSVNAKKSNLPKKGQLKAVKSLKKRTMKITWKKSKGITGYQIYISRKKNFSMETFQRIYKRKKMSTIITGLKSKKKYYVKLRPYKKQGKKIYYGEWSKVKKVKIK